MKEFFSIINMIVHIRKKYENIKKNVRNFIIIIKIIIF